MEGSRERFSPASSLSHEDPPDARRRVLLPMTDGLEEGAVRIARDLAAAADAALLVVDLTTGRGDGAPTTEDVDGAFEALPGGAFAVDHETTVDEGSDTVGTVVQTVADYDVDMLVVDADAGSDGRIRGPAARRMSEHVGCDSVVVSENNPPPSVASVLVPVADGTNAGTAVDAAASIARENDAWIEILHVVDDRGDRATGQEIVERYRERVPEGVETQTWILTDDDVADCIVEQSGHYDLTVVGGSHTSRLMEFVFNSVSKDIAGRADATVLEAYRGRRDLFSG